MQNQNREPVHPHTSELLSPLEAVLVNVWKEVLCVESVRIHDNFFELGGDSISATRIIAQLNQLGIRLTTAQLLKNQTIAELTLALDSIKDQVEADASVAEACISKSGAIVNGVNGFP